MTMLRITAAHELIYAERMRQALEEGYKDTDDDIQVTHTLVEAAIAYCWAAIDDYDSAEATWPRNGFPASLAAQTDSYADYSKPLNIRQLVIAGAFIAAEIERLQRKYNADEKAEDDAVAEVSAEGEAAS
jgi:hypothetical protein